MQEDIDLRPYLRTLLARWRLVLVTTILTTVAAAGISLVVPPSYEARSGLILLKSRTTATFDSDIRTVSEADLSDIDRTSRRRAMAELIASPDVEVRVVAALGDALPAEERAPGQLLGQIEAAAGSADLITVSARATTPEAAMLLANMWAQEAATYINEIYSAANPAIAAAVDEQIARARQQYDEATTALAAFHGQNNIAVLTAQVSALQNTIDYAMRREVDIVQLRERATLLRQQVAARGADPAILAPSVALLFAQATTYTSLPSGDKRSFEATAPLQFQIQPQGPAPTLDALAAQLDTLLTILPTSEVAQEVAPATVAAQRALQQAQQQLEQEQEQLLLLQKERDIAREAYEKLVRRAEEIAVSTQVPTSEVRFAISAPEPRVPENGTLTQALIVGVFAGLLLGVVGALLADLVADGQRRLVPAEA